MVLSDVLNTIAQSLPCVCRVFLVEKTYSSRKPNAPKTYGTVPNLRGTQPTVRYPTYGVPNLRYRNGAKNLACKILTLTEIRPHISTHIPITFAAKRASHTAQPRSAFGGTVTYPIAMPPLTTARPPRCTAPTRTKSARKTGEGYTGGLSSTLGPE